MKCGYCENEIEPSDPAYGQMGMHANCAIQLQKDMTKHGLIFVSPSCRMKYSLTKRFEQFLNRTMNHTRIHITHDGTVDEDIIDLQGVMRAIIDFVKGKISDKQTFLFSEITFNGLMSEKYGVPLPEGKQFSARVGEFVQEVYSVTTTEEESQLFRRILNKEAIKNIANKPDALRGMASMNAISKDLDEELEKATLKVLDIIDKTALKIEELGASKQWRNFRKDEILLQTIEDLILSHLQTAPLPQVVFEQQDVQMFNTSMDALFLDIVELSTAMAKKHNVPMDVVLARVLNNVIMNLVRAYVKIKADYYKKHG